MIPTAINLSSLDRSVLRLLATSIIVPSSPILVTLKMEAILSSETLVLTRATRRNTPEDRIIKKTSMINLISLDTVNHLDPSIVREVFLEILNIFLAFSGLVLLPRSCISSDIF
jgi:hypothetical protein